MGFRKNENDRTYDSDFSPQASQVENTLKGIKIIDENTIEVYTDFWHFDDEKLHHGEAYGVVCHGKLWHQWNKLSLMGKVHFHVQNQLQKISIGFLIIPNDANQVRIQLEKFKEKDYIPHSLIQFNPQNDFQNVRYDSSLKWIDEKNHAVISNGPFYLDRYSPDSKNDCNKVI